MKTTPRSTRSVRGFSLIEVMLAASLGTVLLLATMHTTGVFVESVTVLESSTADDLDRALERIAEHVRYAWWVDAPSTSVLIVADGAGRQTRYELDGSAIKVTDPSGAVGILARGVSSLTFDTETLTRLREGPTEEVSGIIYRTPVVSPEETMSIGDGHELLVAFDIPEDPSSYGNLTSSSHPERVVSARPETLSLHMGYGSVPIYGVGKGSVTFEVLPAAGPSDATIRRGASASDSKTYLNASLVGVEAKASLLIPVGTVGLVPLVQVCHDGRTTAVLATAFLAHVAHGDAAGDCDTSTKDIFQTPSTPTAVDFALSGVELVPGQSYTLRISGSGADALTVLGVYDHNGTRGDTSALEKGPEDSKYKDSPLLPPFTISGPRTVTTTDETEVVSSVTITLIREEDGARHSATASVFTQSLAPDPWFGVVPGELGATP